MTTRAARRPAAVPAGTKAEKHYDIVIDLSKLDWNMLEEIEEISGRTGLAMELADKKVSVRSMKALMVWQLRRQGTKMTMEELGAARLDAFNVEMRGEVANQDPSGAAG